MAKTVQDILRSIEENGIEMADFKMVDIDGQYRHVTIPARNFSRDTLASGVTVTFLGDWIDQDTYACLTPDGTITLHHFSAQK